MFSKIFKYEATCDCCGKKQDVFCNTIKTAVKAIQKEHNWKCEKMYNPDNTENDPCLDYRLLCNKCNNNGVIK